MDDTNTERSQTHLVVGTATTHEDANFVRDEVAPVFFQCADDTLECSGDIGKVRDTTTDDENLAVSARLATGHQVH